MKFYQKWQGINLSRPEGGYFAAEVPGNIQYDYGVAHGFEDLQYGAGCRQYEALENDTWEYRTNLSYQKCAGEAVFFVSKGIDYRYDILLNGETIYSYEGMFRPVELELTEKLQETENILTVIIYPHPKRKGAPVGTRDEADASCKPPSCYGWDWNPRLLVSGMWQEAYVETRDKGYIRSCEVLTNLNDELSVGTVTFDIDCDEPCTVSLFDAEGRLVQNGENLTSMTVESPELWWCNGQGRAYLYTWEVRSCSDVRKGTLGFRKLRLIRNAGATDPSEFPKSRYAVPATIELNGRRILAKGSNLVSVELFGGRVDEARYLELLLPVVEMNMNILRIWGGSGICKDSFYELCDRYGILVWQEFMLACNRYPDTEAYLHTLESEARAIILNLRSHPSLFLWCGGNELFNTWSGMNDQSKALRLLNKLCYELDMDRPFLATSPLAGMGHGGYYFYNDKNGKEMWEEVQSSHLVAYTEFGIPSISPIENLRSTIPEEELFPPKPTEAWMLHHAFGAWGKNAWLFPNVLERYFGKEQTCIEDFVEQSNWLQSEGYKGAFEEMRRQAPHCGMMINWCLNEPWMTAANNNLIAYPAKKKPACDAVRDALRPTLFSAKISKFMWKAGEVFEAELWFLNDSPEKAFGEVDVSVSFDGGAEEQLLHWSAKTEAGENRRGPTVRFLLPNLSAKSLTLTLKSSDERFTSVYRLRYNEVIKKNKPKILNM